MARRNYLRQSSCLCCGAEEVECDDFDAVPFHAPYYEKKGKPKFFRRKSRSHYPLDPRKHPVCVLYEYCSWQNIVQPTFEFYEIPQKVGIEYGCVATVENFVGEGRAFSKKTAKHQAAVNLLKKLSAPNYFGDKELGPRRFVSETGVVSVHYESMPKRRSCFRNTQRMTPPPRLRKAKRVKWQDSEGEASEDEKSSFEDLQVKCPNENLEISVESESKNGKNAFMKSPSVEINTDMVKGSDDENSESEGRFKSTGVTSPEGNTTVQAEKSIENQDLMNDISEYLSERLRRTSIDKIDEVKVKEDIISDEIKVIELVDVGEKKRKRKRRRSEMMDGTEILGRKTCLKEINPIGYLQEACVYFKCDPPSYNFYKEGGRFKAVCTLFDSSTHAIDESVKDAKRLAAIDMIRQLGW